MRGAGLATAAVGVLPASRVKNGLLNRCGHDVHRRARVAPVALLGVDRLQLGDRAALGAFSVYRQLREVALAPRASIGPRNWISAAPSLADRGPSAGRLRLGARATVSTRHRLDCSGGLTLGDDAAIGGWETLVMSHDLALDGIALTAEPVVIGARAFVHAGNRIAAGTTLPDDVRTEVGTVVTAARYEPATRYVGNPAAAAGRVPRREPTTGTTRVVHVLPTVDDAFGGPGPVLAAWLGFDAAAGLTSQVFATVTRAGTVASRLAERSATDLVAPGRVLGRVYGNAAQLRRIGRAVAGADLVVSHSFFHLPGLYAGVQAHRRGVPWVVAPHGSLDPWDVGEFHPTAKRFLGPLWRAVLRGSTMWCVTPREAEGVLTYGARPVLEVVPCPVRTRRQIPVDRAVAHLDGLGLDLGAPLTRGGRVVSFVGRFDVKKGVERLIAAFDDAASDDDVLVIAGSGSDDWVDRVHRAAGGARRRDQLRLPGWIDEVTKQALWSLPGPFALVSDNENFGVAVAEALAIGRPVLITDQVALAPWVGQAEAGVVCTVHHDAVVAGLRRLLRDTEFAERAGHRAAALVEEQWSDRVVADRYREVVARSTRHPSPSPRTLERTA